MFICAICHRVCPIVDDGNETTASAERASVVAWADRAEAEQRLIFGIDSSYMAFGWACPACFAQVVLWCFEHRPELLSQKFRRMINERGVSAA
jgi:hypothetical protein